MTGEISSVKHCKQAKEKESAQSTIHADWSFTLALISF